MSTKKFALSAFDNQRFMLEDGTTSLPLAHHSINHIAVFRKTIEDEEWEDFTSSIATGNDMVNEGYICGADSTSTPSKNSARANTLDFMAN